MSRALLAAVLFVFTSVAVAEESWLTDFGAAKKHAFEKNLTILAAFSGSDWSSQSIELNDHVFAQEIFLKFAEENLVLFLADFPKETLQSEEMIAQNNALAETYGVSGFPTVLLLDVEGKVLSRIRYDRHSAEEYIKCIKEFLK